MLLRLHERCRAAPEPFGWPGAASATAIGQPRNPGNTAQAGASLVVAHHEDADGACIFRFGTSSTPLPTPGPTAVPSNSPLATAAAAALTRQLSGPNTISTSSASTAATPGACTGGSALAPQPSAGSAATAALAQGQQPIVSTDGTAQGSATQQHTPPGQQQQRQQASEAEVAHCSALHPGSVCCTSTRVTTDSTHSACVVTLRASATLTDGRLHAQPSELEELAWLAAREAAAQAVAALNAARLGGGGAGGGGIAAGPSAVVSSSGGGGSGGGGGDGPVGRSERHAEVCHLLEHGTIREARRSENDFGHVSYLMTLEDKATGKRMRACFKPRVEGDCEGWHRVPVEAAAYRLSLLLGMDLVPPAVVRREADVDWTHYPHGGAFIYWCGGARQLNSVAMPQWSVRPELLLSDTRILDVLLQNSDRHAGHFLYAEHWADGEYVPAPPTPSSSHHKQQHQHTSGSPSTSHAAEGSSSAGGAGAHSNDADTNRRNSGGSGGGGNGGGVWRGRLSPVLIDHAAGFRHDAYVCLDHENAFLTGPTRVISARTYLRLRFLDAPSLRSAFAGLDIAEAEIGSLLSRRDAILSFFDCLVAKKGLDRVVLEA